MPLSPGVANDLWCADLKGEFKLGNGHYCYPCGPGRYTAHRKTAAETISAMLAVFGRIDPHLRRSITYNRLRPRSRKQELNESLIVSRLRHLRPRSQISFRLMLWRRIQRVEFFRASSPKSRYVLSSEMPLQTR